MFRLLLALAFLVLAAPGWAQGDAQARCEAGAAAACTAAIDSGQYTGGVLAGLYAARGEAAAEAGRHVAAVADFTAAIAADPADALYLVFRAKAYEAEGQNELAVADLHAALILAPGDDEAGVALARLGSAPVTRPSALGDSLTARIVADPAAEYEPAKAAFAAMLDAATIGPAGDLAHCASGADFLGVQPITAGGGGVNWRFPLYADLAYDMAAWRLQLTAARYPEAAWAPLLAGHEQAKLAEIAARSGPPDAGAADEDAAPDDVDDGGGDSAGDATDRAFEGRLIRALAAWRAAHPALRLGWIGRGAGCSGDDPPAHVTTQPDGAQVRFIPMFLYQLCRADGLDADDPRQCDRWRELREGVLAPVVGAYAYEARWPDGQVLRGRLTVAGNDAIVLAEPAAAPASAASASTGPPRQ